MSDGFSLEESDLRFVFPTAWRVRKFDDTTAYRSLAGHGLRGVDFIALTDTEELWLVEVKNYRYRRKPDGTSHPITRPLPALAAEKLSGKFNDSLRLIRIVRSALYRSQWARFLLWWYRLVGPNPKSNYWFWSEAEARTRHAERVVFVVWMETPERSGEYSEALREELTTLLPDRCRLYLSEHQDDNLPIKAYLN